MNTRKGRSRFKIFRILLDSGCSSVIVMGSLVEKLRPKKYAVMQWNTQDGNIMTNVKVKIDFTLPILSEMNVVNWKCHVDDYTKGIYYMILGQDL